MKTAELEKQILKILEKNIVSYHLEIVLKGLPESCKEIASLIEQKPDCYLKEFVEWLVYGSNPFVRWYDEIGDYFTDELSVKRWSLDELYAYWQTLKDK